MNENHDSHLNACVNNLGQYVDKYIVGKWGGIFFLQLNKKSKMI